MILIAHIFALAVSCEMLTATVQGQSMVPLLQDKEKVLLHRCAFPVTGSIVAVKNYKSNVPAVKLVAGVPGDTMNISNARIYINGRVVHGPDGAPYQIRNKGIKILGLYAHEAITGYLVLGLPGSHDSSEFGLVSKSAIYGVVTKIK